MVRVGLYLAAEMADIGSEIFRLVGVLWPPDLHQQFTVEHHPSGVGYQLREEFIFRQRQWYLALTYGYSAFNKVNGEVTADEAARRIRFFKRLGAA